MAIAMVQSVTNSATSSTIAVTLPSPSTIGDMVCIFLQHSAANTMNISDSGGNVWNLGNTTLNASATGAYQLGMWYSMTTASTQTITLTNNSGNSGVLVAWAAEYSGVSAFGTSAVGYSATATTTPTTESLTYSSTDLVIGGLVYTGASVTSSVGNPFIQQTNLTLRSDEMSIATVIANPTTGSGPAFTLSTASAWGQVVVNFTAVASTIYTNNAEGGTNGTSVTTGNSGGTSGTAFSAVSPGSGGSITFSNTQVNNGALSYALTPASATVCDFGYSISTTSLSYSARAYVYLTGMPSSATQLMRFYSSTALIANIVLGNGSINNLVVQYTGGNLYNGTTSIPLNTWLRLELDIGVGTSTTNGYVYAAIYNGDSATPIDSYLSYAANMGTTVAVSYYVGKVSATGNWATMYIDDIMVNYGNNNMIGPASVSSITGAPTLTTVASIGF